MQITKRSQPKSRLHLEHAVHIRERIGFSESDKNLLHDHNLDVLVAAQYCSSVDFECMSRAFHGIGIRNLHNGFEFFNDRECKQPKTIGVPGLVVVVNSLHRDNRSCLLFENLMDMLAFLTLQKHHLVSKKYRIPPACDYIILNEAANCEYLFTRIDEYNHIFCFFQNTDYGQVLKETILDLHKRHSTDCSKMYSRCQTIADYLRLKKDSL